MSSKQLKALAPRIFNLVLCERSIATTRRGFRGARDTPTTRASIGSMDGTLRGPLNLLGEIRAMQTHLATVAAGENPRVTPQREADVDQFMRTLATAWHGGEVRPTHQSKPKPSRHWRTRADPFEDRLAAGGHVARRSTGSHRQGNTCGAPARESRDIPRRPTTNAPAACARMANCVHSTSYIQRAAERRISRMLRRDASVRLRSRFASNITS